MKETAQEKATRMFTRYQHYYVRSDNKPVATVVVGIRRGTNRVCRGISICSTTQNFDREEGKKRAIARMVEAAENRDSMEPVMTSTDRSANGTKAKAPAMAVDRFVNAILNQEGTNFLYKAGYNVFPTDKERKILSD